MSAACFQRDSWISAVRRVRLNEFDRGLFRFVFSALRQEDNAVVGAAQVFEQRKLPVDNLAFAIFPAIGHRAPPVRSQRASTIILSQPDWQSCTEVQVDIWLRVVTGRDGGPAHGESA